MKHNRLQKFTANAFLLVLFAGLIFLPVSTLGIVGTDTKRSSQVLSAQDFNTNKALIEEYEKIILELKKELRMCKENPLSEITE
jgi:hypothetical protein